MKTQYFGPALIVGAALAGVLGCTSANAQVLGGGASGGLIGGAQGGLTSGGLRNADVFGAGSAAGSFGADLEQPGLRRTTRDVSERASARTRGAANEVRTRATSNVNAARNTRQDVAFDTAATASATAAHTANPRRVDGAARFAGAAASQVGSDGVAVAGATPQEAAQELSAAPTLPSVDAPDAPSTPTLDVDGEARGSASGEADVSRERLDASLDADAQGSADARVQR